MKLISVKRNILIETLLKSTPKKDDIIESIEYDDKN